MTYTFKLSSRLAMMRAAMCSSLLLGACTDGDMSSMSPFDQLGNGGAAAASGAPMSPKAAVVETSRVVQFQSGNGRSWTASGGKISADGTFSSPIAGSFLVVGHGKSRTDTATVTVVNPNRRRLLTISPREVQLAPGQATVFSAGATLANGTPVSADMTWEAAGGTLDKFGNYIAGETPGSFRVIVSAASIGAADTALVTVLLPTRRIVQLFIAPAAAVVVAGGVQQYAATAQYEDGTTSPAAATYAASGGGVIDPQGKFIAGATPGTYEVSATTADGAARGTTTVSVVAPTLTQTLSTASPTAGTLFADDFSSGDLSKSVNGWSWSGASVDVIRGFSHYGNVGSSARFTFTGNRDLTADAWSELRFKVGTTNVTDLWITFWLYYPNGTEQVYRGPRFVHRLGVNGGPTNNKFFRLFHTYQVGYLEVGAETWSDGQPGDGSVQPYARTSAVSVGEQFWNIRAPEEVDSLRGKWLKIELHNKVATAPDSHDGVLQIFRDGTAIVDMRNVDSYPTAGGNFFREGYLLGWANSGFDSTTYAYISDVRFSTQRQ